MIRRLKQLYIHYIKWYKHSYHDGNKIIYTFPSESREHWALLCKFIYYSFNNDMTIKEVVRFNPTIVQTVLRTWKEKQLKLKYFIPRK